MQSVVKQNQSKREITLDTELNIAQLSLVSNDISSTLPTHGSFSYSSLQEEVRTLGVVKKKPIAKIKTIFVDCYKSKIQTLHNSQYVEKLMKITKPRNHNTWLCSNWSKFR